MGDRPFDVRWTKELESECADLRVLGVKRTPQQEDRYRDLQTERMRWKARHRARAQRGAGEPERPPIPALPAAPPERDDDADDEGAAPDPDHEPDGGADVEAREPFPDTSSASTSTSSPDEPPPPPPPEVIDARRVELRDDLVDALEEWGNEINPKPPRFLRRWTAKSLAAVAQKTGMLDKDVPMALAVILSAVGVGAFGVCTFISLRQWAERRRAAGPVIVDAEREAA